MYMEGGGGGLRSFQHPSLRSRLASSQLVRHFLTKLCEPFTLETRACSAGKVARQTRLPFFDDRVVVKAKRVTLFPETIFSHINVALPRSQVFPVYPAMQWHLKLVPSTEQVALLWQGDEEHGSMTVGKQYNSSKVSLNIMPAVVFTDGRGVSPHNNKSYHRM